MGIFFRFRNAQLGAAGGGHHLTERLRDVFLVEEDVQPGELVVVGRQAAVVERQGVHPGLGHILLREDGGDFAGAVVAEVEEDDGVARLDLRQRISGGIGDDGRLDEFIRHARIVGGLHGFGSGGKRFAGALHEQVVAGFDPLPALVAVHRVEAAADRSDPAGGGGHLPLQFFEEPLAAVRVGVAAVHQAVDEDVLQACPGRLRQKLVEMVQRAVHAAVGA